MTVVDNASTDNTAQVAAELAASLKGVAAMRLPRKGRGYALRAAWSTSQAPVVAYMDVDLSTVVACAAASRRAAALRTSGRRDRVAPRPWRARRARPEARADFAGLQPVVEAHAPRPLQRCPVRLQGAASRRGRTAAAACAGQRVVLRHRVAGDGRAPGPAHRRGPGGLGRRSRLERRHRGHRSGRSTRGVAPPREQAKGPASHSIERSHRGPAPALRRRGRRLHARLPVPLRRVASPRRPLRRQRTGHGHRHPLQHRGAPRAVAHDRRPSTPRGACTQSPAACSW